MNIEIGEKFLPIGTVVMLKGGTKKAMITGFCSIAQDESTKIYDYSGCIYPEGYVSANQICLFDHSQIEKVFFKGYVDEEEKIFKDKLLSLVSDINIPMQTTIAEPSVTPINNVQSVPSVPVADIAVAEPVMPVADIPVVEPVMPVADIPVAEPVMPVADIPVAEPVMPVADIPVVEPAMSVDNVGIQQ